MRFSSPTGIVFVAVVLFVGLFGWGLSQWLAQEPDGSQRQAGTGRQVAEDWARDQIVETAPGFTLKDRDGRLRSSDEWEGQVRVVNFWATWCAPCRDEIPLLVDLQREYTDQGVTVLGIAMDQPGAVREFSDEFNINYPVLTGEKETRDLAGKFGSDRLGLPHTFVVNGEGNIAGFYLGPVKREDITPLLESLLADEDR